MKSFVPACLMAATLAFAAQNPLPPRPDEKETRLPNGKSQTEEILKADHEKNLQDAAELQRLSEELRTDLEKNDRFVLSVGTLKKLDQIEKLTKSMRSRLKRY